MANKVPNEWRREFLSGNNTERTRIVNENLGKFTSWANFMEVVFDRKKCGIEKPSPTRYRKLLLDSLHNTTFETINVKSLASTIENYIACLLKDWSDNPIALSMAEFGEDECKFDQVDRIGPATAFIIIVLATATFSYEQWHKGLKAVEDRVKGENEKELSVFDIVKYRKTFFQSMND